MNRPSAMHSNHRHPAHLSAVRQGSDIPLLNFDGLFDRFITSARGVSGGIVLEGSSDRYLHNFAKCCHPIPGDDVVGFVTGGEGIKIHRRGCRNVRSVPQSGQ